MVMNKGPARALAEDGNPLGIATEVPDVLLHPLEGQCLVFQAVVTRQHVILGRKEACWLLSMKKEKTGG